MLLWYCLQYDSEGNRANISVAVGGLPVDDCQMCVAAFLSSAQKGRASDADLPEPGQPYRWTLPKLVDPSTASAPAYQQQGTGFAAVANMMSDVTYAQNIFVAYMLIQSINML
jgi:hypothetical protein